MSGKSVSGWVRLIGCGALAGWGCWPLFAGCDFVCVINNVVDFVVGFCNWMWVVGCL